MKRAFSRAWCGTTDGYLSVHLVERQRFEILQYIEIHYERYFISSRVLFLPTMYASHIGNVITK